MSGYIKDYRKELDSAIWMMPPLYHRIWQYLKYKVNHQENKIPMRDGSFLIIKSGQHLTSVRDIAKNIGWYEGVKWQEPNPKTVTTILKWLETQSMIKIDRGKGNRQYTLITLLNWDSYQQKSFEGNSRETDGEHLVDINKNEKECLKNDQDSATTKNAYEGASDGVSTTDPVRGDSIEGNSVEEISHTPEVQIQKLLDGFVELRSHGLITSADDYQQAKKIIESGISLENALVWMKEKFDSYQPKHPNKRINALSYCVGYIFDRHIEKQEKENSHDKTTIHHYRGRNGGSAGKGKSAEQAYRELEASRKAWGG
ncbi:hypothetical protein AWH48_11400 [Domibacillus aminovorans]|uniref:DNA replication protein DnaD n=1 Tax=Domibacillus aminovorans TaxID=29332 RepID=A0A177KKE6_9BACI|nr:hypothetical protein [Domibacillus aminovorans]OAH53868.1 hypothetical protein AWH48_11400 [Domibacillus aminovorans]